MSPARGTGWLRSSLTTASRSSLPRKRCGLRICGRGIRPLSGNEHRIDGQRIRTYTPWGQLALLAGGLAGYERVRENDLQGVAPARGTLEAALGEQPVLVLIDELVLYMARAFALREDQARSKVNSQWATFLQTLFSIAARRPRTVVILTLPSEQDANRKLTGELKQFIPTVPRNGG